MPAKCSMSSEEDTPFGSNMTSAFPVTMPNQHAGVSWGLSQNELLETHSHGAKCTGTPGLPLLRQTTASTSAHDPWPSAERVNLQRHTSEGRC